MTWTDPTYNHPTLTLPTGDTPLSIEVDVDFVGTWHEGPESDSVAHITEAMVTLTTTFNQLVNVGQGQVGVNSKTDPRDLVTDMDVGLEMLFRTWLDRHLPTHKIIGEEGDKAVIQSDDVVWYIDPIDGTSNFVDGQPGFAIQIGATYGGKPYIGIMGIPSDNKVVWGHCEKEGIEGLTVAPFSEAFPFAVGTEFRDHKQDEAHFFDQVCTELDAEKVRVKSIGLNILHMIEGKSWVFYKADIKFWDCIAPLCVLAFACPDDFELDFFIPTTDHPVNESNYRPANVFGNDDVMVKHLNAKHADSCRIGTLIITPKLRKDLQRYFVSHRLAMPLES